MTKGFYSGYIPKGEHYFGDRYAENSRNAIAEFERDQRCHKGKTDAMQRVRHIQAGRVQPTTEEKKVATSFSNAGYMYTLGNIVGDYFGSIGDRE